MRCIVYSVTISIETRTNVIENAAKNSTEKSSDKCNGATLKIAARSSRFRDAVSRGNVNVGSSNRIQPLLALSEIRPAKVSTIRTTTAGNELRRSGTFVLPRTTPKGKRCKRTGFRFARISSKPCCSFKGIAYTTNDLLRLFHRWSGWSRLTSVDWRISSANERERDGSVGFGYEGRARGNWKIARDLARVVPRKRQTLALPGTWWN